MLSFWVDVHVSIHTIAFIHLPMDSSGWPAGTLLALDVAIASARLLGKKKAMLYVVVAINCA